MKILMLIAVAAIVASCYKDEPNKDQSIFNEDYTATNEFDTWLMDNFTVPYNIEFNYRYNDKLTNNNYNVIPASYECSKALAILIKNVWLDAYVECAGEDFIKSNSFRVFQLIGSAQYNSQGSITLGTAEGGIQVTLFRVNELDIDDIYVNSTDPYRPHYELPLDLNYWYFHTMHHEFCHILTQQKEYSTEFRTISAGKYQTTGWINVDDKDAAKMGFVTGYGSGEYNEDFAEIYSTYVTSTNEAWNKILETAIDLSKDTEEEQMAGLVAIQTKLELVKTYFADSWGIDLDQLREIVLRRSADAANLDLTTLN